MQSVASESDRKKMVSLVNLTQMLKIPPANSLNGEVLRNYKNVRRANAGELFLALEVGKACSPSFIVNFRVNDRSNCRALFEQWKCSAVSRLSKNRRRLSLEKSALLEECNRVLQNAIKGLTIITPDTYFFPINLHFFSAAAICILIFSLCQNTTMFFSLL
jgi:hypothetical protein